MRENFEKKFDNLLQKMKRRKKMKQENKDKSME